MKKTYGIRIGVAAYEKIRNLAYQRRQPMGYVADMLILGHVPLVLDIPPIRQKPRGDEEPRDVAAPAF